MKIYYFDCDFFFIEVTCGVLQPRKGTTISYFKSVKGMKGSVVIRARTF